MNIQESVKAILSVSEHQKALKDFAYKSFSEWRFSNDYKQKFKGKTDDVWTTFDHYVIISETKLKIKYYWGYESEPEKYKKEDHFIVDLVPEIRESKINEIIKK